VPAGSKHARLFKPGADGAAPPIVVAVPLEGSYRVVIGDGLVMFSALLGGHAESEPHCPIQLVAESTQGFDKIGAGDIARCLHRAKTSSRTE